MIFQIFLAFLLAGQVSPHVERGYALAKSGDLKGAEAELREAVRARPADALALALLGRVLSQPGRLAEANPYLEKALQIDPNNVDTRYNLAINQLRLGLAGPARENLERILKVQPGHKQAAGLLAALKPYDIAMLHYRAGRFAHSQAVLEKAIGAGSRDAELYRLLGWCHYRQGRPEQALASIQRALELAPADAPMYSNAGQMLLELQNLKGASAAAAKALELDPDNVAALKLKATTDVHHGDLKQAARGLERAVALAPQDPEALERLGRVQQLLFQYDAAKATFERGLAAFPDYPRMYEGMAKLLLDTGAGEARAVELLSKALALDPQLPDAHYRLGKQLLDQGATREALPHLEAAVKLKPNDAGTHLALSSAYRLLGRAAEQQRELAFYKQLEARKVEK